MFPINKYIQRGLTLIIIAIFVISACSVSSLVSDRSSFNASAVVSNTPSPTSVIIDDQEIKFIIASQPISKGTKIMLNSIGYYNDPGFDPPSNAIIDETEAIGKLAKTDIAPGQLILPTMLVDAFEWAITSSPIFVNEIVYFWSIDGYLYSVDVQTRQQIWSLKIENPSFSSLTITDNMIYFFAGHEGSLYAVDAETGKEKWHFIDTEIENIEINTSLVVVNGVVYFRNNADYLYAIDSQTGQKKWGLKIEQ